MHKNLSSFVKLSGSMLNWFCNILLNYDQFDVFSFASLSLFFIADDGLDDGLMKSNLVLLVLNNELSEFLVGFLSNLLKESLLSFATIPMRLKTSLISEPFILRSSGLEQAKDGLKLTSIRWGLSVSSIRMSYP